MAPPNLQQLLQGVCQQVKDRFGNEGGPFDTHFDISNFLSKFEHRQPSVFGNQQGFRLHFPFPFSGLFFIRERRKNTQVLDSGTIAHSLVVSSNGNVNELNKEVHISKDGEDVGEPFIHSRIPDSPGLQTPSLLSVREYTTSAGDHDGHHNRDPSHGNYVSSYIELQNLQMQLDNMDLASAPASKETLGRATWTFLHTLAAQFPEKPTRQQQRDVKELMAILSRLYPCKECADHFKEVLKASPVQAGSGFELAQWMCRVHNVVNRSLGKTMFPCQRVDARWGALDCDDGACSLQGRMH